MAAAAVVPIGGTPPTTTALPRASPRTALARLVSPSRTWPAGGFNASPGWFWGPEARGATREPSWAPLLACVVGPVAVVAPFALITVPDMDADQTVATTTRLVLCATPGALLGTCSSMLAVTNESVGGLKAQVWDPVFLLTNLGAMPLCVLYFAVVGGFHPFNLAVVFALATSTFEVAFYWRAFETRPPLRRFATKVVFLYSVIGAKLVVITVGFLLLSAETEDSGGGARLALSLGYTLVVWAIKRLAHVEPSMWASMGSMAISEVFVDSLTTLVMLSSVTLMEPLDFAVFLAVSLAAAAVILWWPNIVDALAPRFAKGDRSFRQRRANTIAALNCVVNATTALGTLAISFAFEGRHYFAIANYSDAQQTRLRQYMLVWAGAFVLLGCLLRFLRPSNLKLVLLGCLPHLHAHDAGAHAGGVGGVPGGRVEVVSAAARRGCLPHLH